MKLPTLKQNIVIKKLLFCDIIFLTVPQNRYTQHNNKDALNLTKYYSGC